MELFYVLIYDVLLFQRALLVFSLFFLTPLRIGREVPAVAMNEEGGGERGEESSIPGQRASGRKKKKKEKGAFLETNF